MFLDCCSVTFIASPFPGKGTGRDRGQGTGVWAAFPPVGSFCPVSIRGRHQVAHEVRFLKRLKEDEGQGRSPGNKHLNKTQQPPPGSTCNHTHFCAS